MQTDLPNRFFVTGATGFIGSCLVRRLIELNKEVHILIRHNSPSWRIREIKQRLICHSGDLRDEDTLRRIVQKIRPNVIYHLATYGAYHYQTDADEIIMTNFLGTWNLLKASNDANYDLFLNTGSSSEYGSKLYPMQETDILEPSSYYAVTKSAQTMLCNLIASLQQKPIVTFRPFSVYGPYEEPWRFIPTLLNSCMQKKPMRLVSPETARDFVYVDDVIDAYLNIETIVSHPREIFNIGTGVQSTIQDVVMEALRITGANIQLKWGDLEPRSWDTSAWVADMSKTHRMLNWRAKVSLSKGLLLTWNWLRQHKHLYCKHES